MANKTKLSDEEIQAALSELPGWEVAGGKLHKRYRFDSFAQAVGWMVSVAFYADKLDHHPEWCNVYNRVEVDEERMARLVVLFRLDFADPADMRPSIAGRPVSGSISTSQT